MSGTARANRPVSQKAISLGINCYAALWLAGGAFVFNVFGIRYAMALSLVLSVPAIVALRMRTKRKFVDLRDLVFFAILLIVALGAVGTLVWTWYLTGLDRGHIEDVEYTEFARELRNSSRFRDVKLYVSGKHIFWMRGSVDSQADLELLRELTIGGQIRWNEDVKVTAEGARKLK